MADTCEAAITVKTTDVFWWMDKDDWLLVSFSSILVGCVATCFFLKIISRFDPHAKIVIKSIEREILNKKIIFKGDASSFVL